MLGSYSHGLHEMTFHIHKFKNLVPTESSTVLDYDVSLQDVNGWNETYGDGERYSFVGFKILLTREYGKYLINFYLPSLIFVLVSWISFLIPPDVIPGRMGLLITLLLVLINLFNTVVGTQPPAKSPSALAIWILSCISFVSLALIAYAFLLNKKASFKTIAGKSIVNIKPLFEIREQAKTIHGRESSLTQEQLDQHLAGWDRYFCTLFPVLFTLFNIMYWPLIKFALPDEENYRNG